MPRRIPDYALQFADFNMISSNGALGFGTTQLLFLYAVLSCIRGGAKTPPNRGRGQRRANGHCRR
jgi:cytochrome c oxidase subunit I